MTILQKSQPEFETLTTDFVLKLVPSNFGPSNVSHAIPDGYQEWGERSRARSADRTRAMVEGRVRLSECFVESEGGPTLKSLRLSRGYSQAQLGAILGTSQSHIARLEHCPDVAQLQTCRKLCEALNVDMNTLNQAMLNEEAIHD